MSSTSLRRSGAVVAISVLSSALASALLLGACASAPQPSGDWSSPELGTHSALLRGADVLVACEARDIALRDVCQDQLAAEVAARGGKPIFVPGDTRLTGGRGLDEQLLPTARNANTRAILVMSLVPAASDGGSGLSIGIGGFGYGRSSAIGGGVSVPVAGTPPTIGFAASGRVTDVASGRLVWTARAAEAPSANLQEQCAALAASLLDSAQLDGLY